MPQSYQIPLSIPEIEINLSGDLFPAIRRLIKRLSDFSDIFEEWGEEVALPYVASQWPRPGWEPLAYSTIARKGRLGVSMPLLRTGKLYSAATRRGAPGNVFETRPMGISLGVDTATVPYAIYQHQGTATIPARPWDDLSGPPIVALQAMLQQSVNDAAQGSP